MVAISFSYLIAEELSGFALLLKKDYTNAVVALERECKAGSPLSCDLLGLTYIDGVDVPQDIPKGIKLVEKSCAMYPGSGCISLGDYYVNTNHPDKAISYYSKACYGKGLASCYKLAQIYINKKEAIHKIKAIEIMKYGCEKKDKNSCVDLGVAYYEGDIVPKDLQKSRDYSKKACDLGHEKGCNNYRILTNGNM